MTKIHKRKVIVTVILLSILLFAIALRPIYYSQLNAGPGIFLHLVHETDMNYFDSWAKKIAGSDPLSADINVPMHGWHYNFAKIYSTRHLGQGPSEISMDDASKLWGSWFGRGNFYQDPLYPYVMAAFYKMDSDQDHRHVLIFQQILGIFTVILLFLVAKGSFGRSVGIVTLAMATLYPMALYYEMLLLRESLLLFFSMLLVYISQRAPVGRRSAHFSVFGFVAGLAIVLKSSIAILIMLLIFGMLIQVKKHETKITRLLTPSFLIAVGIFVAFIPLLYRNFTLGLPLLMAKEGPLVFALHNISAFPPQGGIDFNEDLLVMMTDVMSRSRFNLLPTIIESINTHGSLWEYLSFLLEKFQSIWHWLEIPNNDNFYYNKLHAPVLSLLPLSFGVLTPLALPGLVFSAKRWHKCWQLYALVGSNILLLTIFINLSRLKLPLAVALIPFAAYTVVLFFRAMKKQKYVSLGIACLMMVALTAWVNRPMNSGYQLIRPVDYFIPLDIYYWQRMDDLTTSGRLREAAQLCSESLRIEPRKEIDSMANGDPLVSEALLAITTIFRDANHKCANAANWAGMPEEAQEYMERSAQLDKALKGYGW